MRYSIEKTDSFGTGEYVLYQNETELYRAGFFEIRELLKFFGLEQNSKSIKLVLIRLYNEMGDVSI